MKIKLRLRGCCSFLRQALVSTLWELCDDTSNTVLTVLIENNAVA